MADCLQEQPPTLHSQLLGQQLYVEQREDGSVLVVGQVQQGPNEWDGFYNLVILDQFEDDYLVDFVEGGAVVVLQVLVADLLHNVDQSVQLFNVYLQ